MEDFSLLVNGRDVDTGVYEYYPFADKSISDFRTTRKMILALKKDGKVSGSEDFVFARYSVGTDSTNKEAIDAAYNASLIYRKFSVSRRYRILKAIRKSKNYS